MIKITTFARRSRQVYTLVMSIFVKPSAPTKPKTKNVSSVAIIYAVIIVVFVVAQLFTFEEFVALVESYGLPGGVVFARFLAAYLVTVEVFALPFLLRMRVSTAMRVVSMICGWLVALIWFGISLWLVISTNTVGNIGFVGSVVALTPGWWAVFISIAPGTLSIWASWGMWPLVRKK